MFRINADGSRRQIAGLLLADTVLPDELENSSSGLTPARELFDLMKEACLGKLNNTMIKADGTVIPINGAAYNVALRMQSSPKTAEIVIALIDQFPWMRNQHTKRLIRSAVQILKASRQPVAASTTADTDTNTNITLTVSTVEATDSDTWASVLAVDEHNQVIATIANGSIFHPHAVSPEKAMKDTQVKNGAEAMQRFTDQLADPAPAMAAKLQLIQAAAATGRHVRLIVHRALRKQADLVADAVRHLPHRAPALVAKGEYGVIPARRTSLAAVYPVRIGIDTPLLNEVDEDELPYPGQGRLRWVCGTNVATLGVLVGNNVYYYTRSKGKLVIAKTPENNRAGIAITDQNGMTRILPMTRRVFLGRKVFDQKEQAMVWRKSYYLPRETWENSSVFQSMLRLLCEVEKQQEEERSGWEYETFRHRTRHAGRQNGLHGEETNMRFDQHDDQIFQMSPLEELEQTLALHGADRSTIDITMADSSIDPAVAQFLNQQTDDGIRRRSARSHDTDGKNDPTRPIWWMSNIIDTRKLAQPNGNVLAPTTGALVSVGTSKTLGLYIKVRPAGKPTITYTHLENVCSDIEKVRIVKTGDLLGWTECPAILPAETVAKITQVKDCRIKKFDASGNLVEGWVIPANYQEASKYYGPQLLKRIKVAEKGRVLNKQEQKAANKGDCWEFPNVTGRPTNQPESLWTAWSQIPVVLSPEPQPATPQVSQPKPHQPQPNNFTDVWVRWWLSKQPPERKHHNPSVVALLPQQHPKAAKLARKQSPTPTPKELRAAKAAAAAQRKAQMYKKPNPRPFAQRSFNPAPPPAWHEEMLAWDDNRHTVITVTESDRTLAKLVANLIA